MGRNSVIGVEKEEGLASGFSGAQISLPADVADRASNDLEKRQTVGEEVRLGHGSVSGMTVDNDNLEVAVSLPGKVGQKGGEIPFLVEGGDDYRKRRIGHNRK